MLAFNIYKLWFSLITIYRRYISCLQLYFCLSKRKKKNLNNNLQWLWCSYFSDELSFPALTISSSMLGIPACKAKQKEKKVKNQPNRKIKRVKNIVASSRTIIVKRSDLARLGTMQWGHTNFEDPYVFLHSSYLTTRHFSNFAYPCLIKFTSTFYWYKS